MANRIIPITVLNEIVKGDGVEVGSAGSGNDVTLSISFSELWDGLDKQVYWASASGQSTARIIITPNSEGAYSTKVPFEAKREPGRCRMVIAGGKLSGDHLEKETVSATAYFRVLESTDWPITAPDLSPSAADQLQAAIDSLGRTKLDSLTIKSAGIPEIVSPETLRTYFYEKRKETSRSWQFEVSTGNNENLINALGGFPDGHTAAEKWFLYINLPYTEAGGFVIHAQLEGRGNGKLYRQDQFATLDQRWHTTGWIRIEDVQANLEAHMADQSNPHKVTAKQVGAVTPGAMEAALKDKADTTYVNQKDADTLAAAKQYADEHGKVQSVNGMTGDVVLAADDVGALAKNNPTGTGALSMNRKPGSIIGAFSTAEGSGTTASGTCSHAEGEETEAATAGSHAEGLFSKVTISRDGTSSPEAAHAEGFQTSACAKAAHAEGVQTKALGDAAHAEGSGTVASSVHSHAEGLNSYTSNTAAHAEGVETKATGYGTHAEGWNTEASGYIGHAEGVDTKSIGSAAHAEGRDTIAEGIAAHAEGKKTSAKGIAAHAEGESTEASGDEAHAEGYRTIALRPTAHAEGIGTRAEGQATHSEGIHTSAISDMSHAEGQFTIATAEASHAQGKFNIEDLDHIFAHIVGNGTEEHIRSNAHTVDWDGNAEFAGDVYVQSTCDAKTVGKKLATEEYVDQHSGSGEDPAAEKWATVAVKEALTDITDEDTFRTHFYNLRKSRERKYQFEMSEGGIHENVIAGAGGRPAGANAKDKAFLYAEIPFSEAGGFIIQLTYELRTKPGIWVKTISGTLDSTWSDSGWYEPASLNARSVLYVQITPEGDQLVCDHTASQILAHNRGQVIARYTDEASGEDREYLYFKRTSDGKAVFTEDGYIEDGNPKQTLFYVDYAGNVEVETRTADLSAYLKKPAVPGTEGQFAVFNADGSLRGVTLPNLDKEAR